MRNKYLAPLLVTSFMLTGCQDKAGDVRVCEKTTKVRLLKVSDHAVTADKRYTGTVEESSATTLSFPLAGTVSSIYVKQGDRVSRGQVIACMDTTTYSSAYNAAQASLNQAQDAYRRLKILYEEKSLPEIKWIEIQSKLQQAKAMAEVAGKNLKDCRIKAPYDGIIARKSIEIGQNVVPGVPIVELVSMKQVKVKVSVPEGDISAIRTGDSAQVRISAAGNLCLEGCIVEKGVVANPLSRSYEVKITVENDGGKLLPGMVTDVVIRSGQEASAIVLPPHFIQTDEQNRTFVWLNQGDKAHKRIVTCGPYTPEGVVIADGLTSGDEIIISGQHKVCEGTALSL